MTRMASLDKKQIKRMVVETTDGSETVQARIRVRLWNATGTPLYNLPPPGGERQAPLEVLFPNLPIATAPTFTAVVGTKIMQRGANAAPPVTAHTELAWLPTPNSQHDTAIVEFTIGATLPNQTRQMVVIQCGNATWVGNIVLGEMTPP